jgi:hypothetical protein
LIVACTSGGWEASASQAAQLPAQAVDLVEQAQHQQA